jgi:hypothetical protein
MGARGPVPKRADQRAGHRAKSDRPDRVTEPGNVKRPPSAADWSPEARAWYRSLEKSGEARFFEPSDWQYARLLARLLTDEMMKSRRSSEMIKAVLAGMDNLGTTEAARRRMRIEVERHANVDDGVENAKVSVLDQYRALG